MPLLSSWSHASTEEMEDLHEVACLRKHQDANAKHVMTMMQSSYDWHSLTKGIPVLKEEWRFVLPRVPLAVAVLAKAEVLNKSGRALHSHILMTGMDGRNDAGRPWRS